MTRGKHSPTEPSGGEADVKTPEPAFRITLDGRDLTSRIAPRLGSLTLTETRGEEADQLDLVLDDTDGQLALPSLKARLHVAIGWADAPLVNKGQFTVDEIEHAGAPDVLTIRARSAALMGSLRERREASWHDTTLGAVVDVVAGRNALTPQVAVSFARTLVAHIDQTNESDISFLQRLARHYDAVMNVKDGNLLFMPAGAAQTRSGHALSAITLTRREGDQHRYHQSERERYQCVCAYWHSTAQGRRHSVHAGDRSKRHPKTLPQTYGSAQEAQHAANAEWRRVQRGKATLSYSLALGQADLMPERPVTLSGVKAPIDATRWVVARVTHTIGDGGFVSALELDTGT